MNFKKRGQITVFIIIGIILLLGVATVLFIQQTTSQISYKAQVPEQLVPVYTYIQGCIDQIAEEDIKTMGVNGGYLEIPQEILNTPESFIEQHPGLPLKLPLWWYKGQSRIPTESFMIEQLQKSMNAKIKECVDFNVFKEFALEEISPITTEVAFTDTGIVYDIVWPLQATTETESTPIDRFVVTKKIRIKRILELAKDIMERENQDAFFEDFTMDLIALDPDVPDTNFEIKCSPRIWLLKNVEDKFKRLLEVNLPSIKLDNGEYIPHEKDRPYEKNHYVWNVGENEYPNIHTSFNWNRNNGMDFYVSPNNGVFLSSGVQKGQDVPSVIDMSWLCLQIYHFTYDIEYPITVTLRDAESRRNDPFTFNFAFPVVVSHNIASRETLSNFIFDFEKSPESEEFCKDRPNQVTIKTKNKVTKEDIPDINISFDCFKFKCGHMGTTDWMAGGALAGIDAKLPLCYGGLIKAKGTGFKEEKIIIDTDREDFLTMEMTPIKTISNYSVVKHDIELLELANNLDKNEQAVIFLRNDKHSTFGVYPSEEQVPLELLADSDFTYKVDIYLINDEKLTGGYEGNWTISNSELKDSEQIIFHALSTVEPIPDDELNDKMIEFLQKIPEVSKILPMHELK